MILPLTQTCLPLRYQLERQMSTWEQPIIIEPPLCSCLPEGSVTLLEVGLLYGWRGQQCTHTLDIELNPGVSRMRAEVTTPKGTIVVCQWCLRNGLSPVSLENDFLDSDFFDLTGDEEDLYGEGETAAAFAHFSRRRTWQWKMHMASKFTLFPFDTMLEGMRSDVCGFAGLGGGRRN